ncbi:SGNH/GDSL hydrolase family protein [soil metagenome]
MRTVLAFSALLCLPVAVACGESSATGRPAPKPLDQATAPLLVHPDDVIEAGVAAPAGPPGPLDNAAALKRFFAALSHLDDGSASEDVRVVQFGDSHTAADLESAMVRRTLQTRFGDGGRGFVEIGRPWKTYIQDGLRAPGMSKEWLPEHGKLEHGKFVGDGCYGLNGVCLLTAKKGARTWADISVPASRIEVDYFEQPVGGSFELLVDGAVVAKVSTKGKVAASAFKTVDVPDLPHHIELRTATDGEVRVFGVALDRLQLGIVWDALGINGARASTTLQWSEPHFKEQLAHRAPHLVVFAYGTNESADEQPVETLERQLVDALGRIARSVPTASCLILGPPDRAVESSGGWITAPKLENIIDMERDVARAAGCAFYNQLAAMGGPGTIALWSDQTPARAQKDRVHYTRDSYAAMGTSFANDVLRAYANWRAEQGLAPAQNPPPKAVPPPTLTIPPPHDDEPGSSPFVALPM